MHIRAPVWDDKALARPGLLSAKGERKAAGGFALFGIGYNLSRAENMYTFDELIERAGRETA